jgi:hypothetical protein
VNQVGAQFAHLQSMGKSQNACGINHIFIHLEDTIHIQRTGSCER